MSQPLDGRGSSGPFTFGGFLQPPTLCALDERTSAGVERDRTEFLRQAAERGSAVCWSTDIDGATIFLTHGGGVFARLPAEPASHDPAARDAELRFLAVELMNLAVCELALAADVPAAAFSIAEIASCQVSEDASRIETWAGAMPYGAMAMRIEADLQAGSTWVDTWQLSRIIVFPHPRS